MSAQVKVLKQGYANWKGYATQRACGSITLVVSESNLIENRDKNIIIVDIGVPSFKKDLLKTLKEENITPEKVNYVISTHSDIDHIGNLNLFPKAIFIAGSDIIKQDVFIDFFEKRYAVDENVKIIATAGHDSKSISVIVKTEEGIIAIVGDLFEKEEDWKEEGTWEVWSQDPKTQARNRARIWKIADFIVPGHGAMFKVNKRIDLAKVDKKRLRKALEK
jgi:glyoxylase-like metal-dependent hydrolase (beta-lactamase superfamily II)